MSATAKQQPVDNLSFEAALQELEGIVKELESGKAPLENSITAYERGVALKKHCEKKLREAQEKIEKITINENGEPDTTPLESQE